MGFADWFMRLTTGSGLTHKPMDVSLEYRTHRAVSFLTRPKIFLEPTDVETLLDDLLYIIDGDEKFDYINFLGEAFPNLRSLILASASVQRNVRRLAEKNGESLELTMATKIKQEMQMSPKTKEHLTVVLLFEEALTARLLAQGLNPFRIPFLTNVTHSVTKLNELYRGVETQGASPGEKTDLRYLQDLSTTHQTARGIQNIIIRTLSPEA